MRVVPVILFFFFFNDTATTEIYPLPLHDALPISSCRTSRSSWKSRCGSWYDDHGPPERRAPEPCEGAPTVNRSEEHTSELQSRLHLVCRLLLEKKKQEGHIFQMKIVGCDDRNSLH